MKAFPKRGPRRVAKLILPLAVAMAIMALPLAGSNAASPGAGTVSQSSPSVNWTGGLMLATGGGCTGADDPNCDNYKLTIQPPASDFQVRILLQPTGDWDLAVYGPNGGLAGSSGNGPNQLEVVTLTNPPAGTYTVAASPFAPAVGTDGNSYRASATMISLAAPNQPPAASEGLSFSNYHAPNGMGGDSGEPSIGADWKTGATMFQAGLQTLKVTWDDSVSPATPTWKDVTFPTTSAASLDPIGFMDQRTSRWFSSQLSGTTSLAALTDDDGATWIPSEGGPGNGGVDHQTFGGGPYAAPLTRDPNGALYPDAVYYCSQDLVAALCARSDNGGISFAPAVPIYTDECGGLHGHVTVAPDGTVYVPNRNCGGKQAVVVSEDNGLHWSVRPIPGSTNGAWDPNVAVGADNTVYFGYDDGDGHAKVAVSHDHGQTWTNVRDVGLPVGVNQSAFPRMVAGDGNRAAIAFLGTDEKSLGAFGDDPSWPGVWYLYVATTYDGGNTWTTVNASPNDPVQRGTICAGGFNGCNNGTRNLLDFMGATVDKQGRVLVGYPDGCIDACVAAGPGSFTSLATIARQVNGRGLFAKYDTNTVPAAPVASAKSLAGTPASNVINWQAPNDGGSPITGYKVYRRTAGTQSAVLATVSGSTLSYTDTQVAAGETYYYKVSAVNANGEGQAGPEVSPVAPPPPEDPCVEPGVRILSDGTGDSTGGDPAKDLQWLAIAEPSSLGAGKLEFELKVASLASVPANTTWPVLFATADGADHFVKMETDALGNVTFAYGDGSGTTDPLATTTPADPASRYTTDGTIRIVVPRSAFKLSAGDQLKSFIVRVSVRGGAISLTPDNMPDSLARTGAYTVKGNENCSVPQADLAVTSSDITLSGLKGAGNDQVVVAVVHNLGTAGAANVPVMFTADGKQFGATQKIASIAAGATARVSAVWNTSGQNGTHTLAVTADPAHAIAESNESNNTGSRTVSVRGSKVG